MELLSTTCPEKMIDALEIRMRWGNVGMDESAVGHLLGEGLETLEQIIDQYYLGIWNATLGQQHVLGLRTCSQSAQSRRVPRAGIGLEPANRHWAWTLQTRDRLRRMCPTASTFRGSKTGGKRAMTVTSGDFGV